MKKYQLKRRKHIDEKFTFIIPELGSLKNIQFQFDFSQAVALVLAGFLFSLSLYWAVPHTLILYQKLSLIGYDSHAQQNRLQKRQIQNFVRSIEKNQNHLFAVRGSEQEIRRTLGMQVEYDNQLLNFSGPRPTEVRIRTAMVGERVEKKEICIGNRPLLNFYTDRAKKYRSTTSPETLARILETLITNQQTDKQVQVIAITKNKEYVGMIEGKEVFRVTEKDTPYYSSEVRELAESFATKINAALAGAVAQKVNPFQKEMVLDMPIERKLVFKTHSSQEKIQHDLDALMETLAKTRERLLALQRESVQLSRQFAQTPSTVPIKMPISSMYGYRVHPIHKRLIFHSGVDFEAYWGSYVRATASGRVVYAGWHKGYGNMVRIYHGWGLSTLYAHNSKLIVEPGQWVQKGRVIARAGATGMAAGAHVHYEVHRWGRAINPLPYLNNDILSASTAWE